MATRGLKIVEATSRLSEEPQSNVTILEVVLEDDLNGWRHEIALVGTRRGIQFNFVRKDKLPENPE
ncbi:MAG: hypothetical protein GWN58_23485 [Anaerolineae bacterium]|nr:hypothetical protein [Thermoplasmata archaeon]NIV32294.1 hypothetical protein [Anaerolineae bacterium]NIY03748.1 hypothetical protein [Thermoplasmata archaeon]